MKESVNVQSVSGTGFNVDGTFELGSQQARSCVGNHSRVDLTDHVLSANQHQRHFTQSGAILCHLRVIRVDRIETDFTLQTERQDDCVDPARKLSNQQSTHKDSHISVSNTNQTDSSHLKLTF